MINIPDTLPVIPRTVREIINDSPFVWVIFAYDSSNKDLYPGFSLKLEYHFFNSYLMTFGAVELIPNRDEKIGSGRAARMPAPRLN